MVIVLYAAPLFKKPLDRSNIFIVQTIFSLAKQDPNNQLHLIVEKGQEQGYQLPPNCQFISARTNNPLLKKIWWNVKLPRLLRKIEAAVFISFDDRCSLNAAIPQCLVTGGSTKPAKKYVTKASLVFTSSQYEKKQLKERTNNFDEKIKVVYQGVTGHGLLIDNKELEGTKKQYCDGKEFFFYNSSFDLNEHFIDLLKSFSLFKKRQQSSMKLLLLSKSNSFFEKSMASYKYREDVRFIDSADENENSKITAAAYAVVLPFNSKNDMSSAFLAMQVNVPVIISTNSPVHEISDDAALFSESVKETADRMMQLYTNETFRSELIEKGKSIASGFTIEKTAELWWRSIKQFLH